ncbi:transcriptional regulator [Chitinibacter fontanus]|uniref:Transcriptional regulator n=1 Tax=Chitinibacter fontanus TaxID=1737446 RepID=A0A7D5Z4X8_9NEIS|nr:transcriptional regulator [Chitinibacter fontanus]QLI81163.1 transcriptional regulator [Chitinibacter fontanus]
MTFHTKTMLTIVTEAVLENDLVALFEAQKVRGWTIVAARGKGAHGEKRGSFDANENIQIELIIDTASGEALAEDIMRRFGEHYALVQWLSEVRVLRGNKF